MPKISLEVPQELLDDLTADGELSGLLNVALDGLDRLREQGDVSLPETHEERLEYYEQFSDPIKEFRINCLENERGTEVKKAAVYDVYKRFCRDQGYAVKDERVFFRTLRQTTLTYDQSRPMRDGERVRVLNDAKFTETGLEYAPASIIGATEDEEPSTDEVDDLTAGDDAVTVEVVVADRRPDQPGSIAEKATLTDTSGEIEAVVWDSKGQRLEEGRFYRITNAHVDEYRGSRQLNINATTAVEEIQAGVGNAPTADAEGDEQLGDAAPDGGEVVQTKELVQNLLRDQVINEPITAAVVSAKFDTVPETVDHVLSDLANQREPLIAPAEGEGYRYL